MRNLFMEDFKNVRKEVLALKQSYIRGLNRINCYVSETTCHFTANPGARGFRLTVQFITSSNNEPFNLLNEHHRIILNGKIWDGNSKEIVEYGLIHLSTSAETDYTFKIISTAPVLSMFAEQIFYS